MTWLVILALAVVVLAALKWPLRMPRDGREAVIGAILIALAGYAVQGSPSVPAAPKAAATPDHRIGSVMVDVRQKMSGVDPTRNKWQVVADALMRGGDYAGAAGMLRGAVEADPRNGEAWLSLANALTQHADGTLTPPALYAYRQAMQIDPEAPGAPFFLGMALAQQGKFDEARAMWGDVLAKAPADAPWRKDMEQRVAQLDLLLSRIRAAQQGQGAPSGSAVPAMPAVRP
ncbi:tetratricopeptide repeat protein [Novosphingobium sp. FSY-8]|uniref:Tetratricopeptide repeat protein n=1 Tax=Novosphingobium ovatum TaxID=1908523 RepID=A0ABW9XD23_9SPHN|nr:tetratricopeptide repeat protein [Novosphingobium ovatum]NBC36405.1 tetratricopeptide repeat protein [Novosphingobium ovatum]